MVEFDLTKPYCRFFQEICGIPHGSRNERQLSNWLVAFAKARDLRYFQDELYNVVIYKPASEGYKDHPGVILQAHMDMVCEKTQDSTHDFEKDSLELYVDGDHLRARGTTLGADDGMGCAYMLAVLDDPSLSHPELECCFTTQEEVGLEGAQALKPEYFRARRLINLDGAGEYKTYMSMGGGEQIDLALPIHWESDDRPTYRISIRGLLGGHSGGMIDKERANAGKLMARLLMQLEHGGVSYRLRSLCGGTKHNGIMAQAEAVIATDAPGSALTETVARCETAYREEYELSDPGIVIELTRDGSDGNAMIAEDGRAVIRMVSLLPFGLRARNLTVQDNPPETSVNLGVIRTEWDVFRACVSARSALDCAVDEIKRETAMIGELFGATATFNGYYPGWKYEPKSSLREVMRNVFFRLYGKPLNCLIGHGGNECGVFKRMFPEMDIVTSGAIYGNIHTTQEFLDLASFDRAWTLLTQLLRAL